MTLLNSGHNTSRSHFRFHVLNLRSPQPGVVSAILSMFREHAIPGRAAKHQSLKNLVMEVVLSSEQQHRYVAVTTSDMPIRSLHPCRESARTQIDFCQQTRPPMHMLHMYTTPANGATGGPAPDPSYLRLSREPSCESFWVWGPLDAPSGNGPMHPRSCKGNSRTNL